jgi:hypothetical protein
MSDAQDIRDWAREQGRAVSDRGTISQQLRTDYEAAQLEQALTAGPAEDEFTLDDGDVSDAAAPPADVTEKRPRSIATPRGASSRSRWGRPKAAAKGKGKAKHPRVPVDDLIATIWRGVAGMVRPLPATSRLLKIQAPVAGAVLEPVVKGTVVDTWLQPLARTTEGAEALIVLAGPPILVAVMELDPSKVPFLLPVCRELMLRWCKIGGPKMAEAMKRDNEFEDQFGATVDSILSVLQTDLAPEDEDAAVREVQESMQGAAA